MEGVTVLEGAKLLGVTGNLRVKIQQQSVRQVSIRNKEVDILMALQSYSSLFVRHVSKGGDSA